jgi:hypothetical protein
MIDDLIQRVTGQGGLGLAAGAALLLAYVMPLAIAIVRKHHFTGAIGAINLLMGWTVIGWFAALFWAVNRDVLEQAPAMPRFGDPQAALEPQVALEPVWTDAGGSGTSGGTDAARKCPFCAELVKAEAVVCRYCARDLAPVPQAAPYGTLATDSLDERDMKELYDLLQEMERDAEREYHEAKFADVMNRVDEIQAEIRSDGIRTDDIVISRNSGTAPAGKRRTPRIQKAG